MKTFALGALLLCSTLASLSLGAVTCENPFPVPPVVAPAPSVQVADYMLVCQASAQAETLTFDLSLILNTSVTSLPVDALGHVESLLIIESVPFSNVNPTIGVDGFYATMPAANALRWSSLVIPFDANELLVLRMTNIFANAQAIGSPGPLFPGLVLGLATASGAAPPAIQNPQATMAYVVGPVVPPPVPEPASALAMSGGLGALVIYKLRRRK